MSKDYIFHVDGHTREKKKFGVYGFTVREGGKIVDTKQGYIGTGISNFQAEYQALLKSLNYIVNKLDTKDKIVRIYLDSGRVYKKCKNSDNTLVGKFLNKISGEVKFKKTNSDGVRNAHLLCSSQYTLLHLFPGYIRELEPENLIKKVR